MDIDIDFQTTFNVKTVLKSVVLASRVDINNNLVKHPCGAYLQNMPIDPVTGLAAIPYEQAEQLGYMKIDFLHLSALDLFDNKRQIRALLRKPPKWGLMLRSDVVMKLFQLNNNVELVQRVQPKSVLEIADCISLIRPGKLELLDEYIQDRSRTREKLYKISKSDKYSYKKGHALSYAMVVVLQLHMIEHGIL